MVDKEKEAQKEVGVVELSGVRQIEARGKIPNISI